MFNVKCTIQWDYQWISQNTIAKEKIFFCFYTLAISFTYCITKDHSYMEILVADSDQEHENSDTQKSEFDCNTLMT